MHNFKIKIICYLNAIYDYFSLLASANDQLLILMFTAHAEKLQVPWEGVDNFL